MTTKQLTTALISSLQKAVATDEPKDSDTTKKSNANAENSFGGREGVKRAKTE